RDDIALLNEPQIAAVATVNADGSVQLTPVWVDTDGEAVLFNTAKGRVKHQNIERNPNVSVLVVDTNDVHRWVSVRGSAEITEEGADAHIDRLALKYTGRDFSPSRQEGQVRITVRIVPEHRMAD
ncbi:MAG: PPOX class F420-dependent oxidoreductase, partial [Acidimicrobiales bacterium]